MAATTAFAVQTLGLCLVAVAWIVARARVEIARIQAQVEKAKLQ